MWTKKFDEKVFFSKSGNEKEVVDREDTLAEQCVNLMCNRTSKGLGNFSKHKAWISDIMEIEC